MPSIYRTITASDAKIHLHRLLDEVERGATFIITRHGRPIARLVPEAVKKAPSLRNKEKHRERRTHRHP